LRALHSTNAESPGHTARSSQEDRQALQEAGQREEVVGHHGCSRPGELHRVADDLEEHHTGCEEGHRKATDQEGRRREIAGPVVLRTGNVAQEGHRMEIVVREGRHMAMARVVHRKETAQGVHHREKEQAVRRMATGQEEVHRKAIVQEVVVLGGKEAHRIGLKAEGQRA
jgi:hypothetical protein